MTCLGGVGLFLVLSLSASCSSCSGDGGSKASSTPGIPSQLESGFVFERDAIAFGNYGADQFGTELTTSHMIRMFGEQEVCAEEMDPCVLTPVADAWRQSVSRALGSGHSEGFSILTMLLHSEAVDVQELGAENAGQLRIVGNQALQDEITYWAATQFVHAATQNDVRKAPEEVMPFLAQVLDPQSEDHYRMAIVRRTERGFEDPHSLVPFGFFKGEGDVFWLRVYDSNFPSREQRLEINPVANTWRYEITTILGEPLIYEGGAQNPLYFSKIEDRLGTLPSPFSEESEFTTILSDPTLVLLVDDAEGRTSGIQNGQVIESDGHRVEPVFTKCPGCGDDFPITNQRFRGFEARDEIQVTVSNPSRYSMSSGMGMDGSSVESHTQSVSTFAGTRSATVRTQGQSNDTSDDTIVFEANGDVSYTSRSAKNVSVRTSSATDSVTVEFSQSGDEEVTVKVERQSDGSIDVVVEGLPEGTDVTVTFGRNYLGRRAGTTTKFKATGERSTASIDTIIRNNDPNGAISVTGGNDVQGGVCTNGQYDAAFESGVDCGNTCGKCRDGGGCRTNNDCANNLCEKAVLYRTGVCKQDSVLITCMDNGMCTRTPVCADNPDCDEAQECQGQMASYCGLSSPTCQSDSDCTNGVCSDITPTYAERGVCKSALCNDGAKNGSETDIDCGGDSCAACVASTGDSAQVCLTHTDCDSGLCSDGRCRPRIRIALLASGFGAAAPEGSVVNYTLDGQMHSKRMFRSASGSGFSPVELGSGWNYQMLWIQGCQYDDSPQSPPEDVSTGRFYTHYFRATCNALRYTIQARITYEDGLAPIPSPNPNVGFDDYGEMEITYGLGGVQRDTTRFLIGSGFFNLQYDQNWSARISKQPNLYIPAPAPRVPQVGANAIGRYDCQITSGQMGKVSTGDQYIDVLCSWLQTTCSDGVKNQGETDIDCGGSNCGVCMAGQACEQGSDCITGRCENSVCTMSNGTCDDMTRNQDETDVDCGGSTCGACANGLMCDGNSDCQSGRCMGGTCAMPSCSDGIRNQDETDVDCGGATCAACGDGQGCALGRDCTSLSCVGGMCAAPSCSDGIQNQDETDVDCGGATCATRCGDGASCVMASDCDAMFPCSNGVCGASCSDGIKNQDETGVDCGGSTCGACGTGQACSTDSECISNNCYCAASSGNCAGATGFCGESKLLVDQPVTDGASVSGTFTVPANCSTLYVQAWGAAGGSESLGMGTAGQPGGAGGFVHGTLSVAQGDVVTVWLGQGGGSDTFDQGFGSLYGTAAHGGDGNDDLFAGGGGEGGGLTSVQITGSATQSFSVPGGGGTGSFTPGQAASTGGGGGAVGNDGESASFGSMEPGGGAGEPGGTLGQAGAYGMLPMGLVAEDGFNESPAGTTHEDYAQCLGANNGMPGAAAGDAFGFLGIGGDGCVVLRCVAP